MPRWTREQARSLDEADELAPLRQQFQIPPGIRYFNGNSLGLLSRPAEAALFGALETWRSLGGEGWFRGEQPWLELVAQAAALMAPLVGAEPEAVTVANSTTVNLHQLLSTLFHPTFTRRRILVDDTIFCSDLYAVRSHLKLRSLDPDTDLVVVPTADGALLDEEAIVERMTGDIACAVFSSVVYNSGQLLDLERITRAARERGIVIGFDCSHSVGCIPHELSRWDADFAFWCGYKYLNGGPGAPSGMFLNRRHFGSAPGLAGWFGCRKDRLLNMPRQMEPAADAEALQISTPFILSLSALLGSLSLVSQAGIDALRAKSLRMTGLLIELIDHQLSERFAIVTPRDGKRRGGHVAIAHPDAQQLCRALRERNVVADYRSPNIIRLAPSPFYNSFDDCFEAVEQLRSVMDHSEC
jgi:kynureninase